MIYRSSASPDAKLPGPVTARWIVAVTGLAMLLLWSTTAAYIAYDRERSIARSEQQVAGAVSLLHAHATRTLEGARASLSMLDAWLSEQHYATQVRPLYLIDTVVSRLRGQGGSMPDVRLFDAEGRIFDFETGIAGARSVVPADAFVRLAGMRPGQILIEAPILSPITGVEAIPMMTPVQPNRYGVAYVGIGIPTAAFAQPYEDARPKPSGLTALLRSDAMLLARAPGRFGKVGERYPRLSLFADHRTEQQSGTYRAALNGQERIAAFATLPDFGVIVISTAELDAILAEWREQAIVAILVLLLASIAIGTGCTYIVRLFHAREVEFRRTREALAQAAAANQVKSDFLAKMSHELHTPLNAILGFSEVIAGAVLGPISATYRQYGGDIHASGQHLLNLVDGILDASMTESGQARLAEDTVDLQRAADAGLEAVRQACNMGGVRTEVRIAEDARLLRADGRLVRRMLGNLIGNAVKFSNPGGIVTVTAQVTGQGLELAVNDTGIGMPPGALAHVFEPFGRGDSFVSRPAAGLGLGLPGTKALIELHGGRIEIESAPGAGTRAVLIFPASRIPAPAPAQILL